MELIEVLQSHSIVHCRHSEYFELYWSHLSPNMSPLSPFNGHNNRPYRTFRSTSRVITLKAFSMALPLFRVPLSSSSLYIRVLWVNSINCCEGLTPSESWEWGVEQCLFSPYYIDPNTVQSHLLIVLIYENQTKKNYPQFNHLLNFASIYEKKI